MIIMRSANLFVTNPAFKLFDTSYNRMMENGRYILLVDLGNV